MADTWKRWVEAFWFLRGIAAAMTLAVLIPKFTDLSRFEFLRAFHALVVRWNDFAAWIGGLIGMIPFLPELDAEVVNCIIFCVSVGLPSGIAFAIRISQRREAYSPWQLYASLSVLIYPLAAALIYYLVVDFSWFRFSGFLDAVLLGGIISFAIMFGLALVTLNGYAKGLFLVVTFILTMQVLYWLNTPWLSDQINAAVESALRASP